MKVMRFNEAFDINNAREKNILLKDLTDHISDDYNLEVLNLGDGIYEIRIQTKNIYAKGGGYSMEINTIEKIDDLRKELIEREKLLAKCKEILIRSDSENYKIDIFPTTIMIYIDFNESGEEILKIGGITLMIFQNRFKKVIKSKFGFSIVEFEYEEPYHYEDDEMKISIEFDESIDEDNPKFLSLIEYLFDYECFDEYVIDDTRLTISLNEIGDVEII